MRSANPVATVASNIAGIATDQCRNTAKAVPTIVDPKPMTVSTSSNRRSIGSDVQRDTVAQGVLIHRHAHALFAIGD